MMTLMPGSRCPADRRRPGLLWTLAAVAGGMALIVAGRVDAQPAADGEPPAVAEATETQPAIMALVDGSGSMWGGLGSEGNSKLTATRLALEGVLPRLVGSHRLGLATFGPGCRAASVTVAPDESGPERVTTPLVRFNPRGKGPLSAGLRAAADAFGQDESGTIILFHDGLDNCGEDQCATAAELHAARPGLKVSTISLGMEPAQVAAIACVAKTTGGRAYAADDPDGVMRALSEIANLIERPEPAAPTEAAAVAVPKPAEKGPSRLLASARLVEGGAPVSMPLNWRVTSPDGKKVWHEAVAPSLTVPMAAGPKRVTVTSGRISVTRDVEIAKEGDSVLEVGLNAGIVRFDTGAKRLASDAEEPLIRLEELTGGGQQTGAAAQTPADAVSTPLWIARGKAIEAMLPPGDYRAVAEYGLAHAAAPVRVSAGKALNLSLPLEAGRLELSTAGAGPASVIFRIEVDDPDRPGGRRELTRTVHAAPAFVLSTGSYYVTASVDGEELRRLVTVRSGEVTRETFKPDMARLEVSATVNGEPPGRAPLMLNIRPVSDSSEERQRVGVERPVSLGSPIDLAPGRYLVTLRYGLNGASVVREVQLGANQQQRFVLDLKTAEISLDTTGTDGTPQSAVCELKTSDGAIIWRTVEISPRRIVSPGQYTLRCQAGKGLREIAVTTAAGQVTRVAPFAQ